MKAKIPANIERDLRNIEREANKRHQRMVAEYNRTKEWPPEPTITQAEFNRSEGIWAFLKDLLFGG